MSPLRHPLLWQLLYIFVQVTWGFFQSLLGFVFFFIFMKSPQDWYYGCIRTRWPLRGGISLGLFIFTPDERRMSSLSSSYTKKKWRDYCAGVSVHEFGHTIQSLIMGPFYLPIVGLVSLTWARADYFRQKRRRENIPYSACWTESWANNLGERLLKQPAIRH